MKKKDKQKEVNTYQIAPLFKDRFAPAVSDPKL